MHMLASGTQPWYVAGFRWWMSGTMPLDKKSVQPALNWRDGFSTLGVRWLTICRNLLVASLYCPKSHAQYGGAILSGKAASSGRALLRFVPGLAETGDGAAKTAPDVREAISWEPIT